MYIVFLADSIPTFSTNLKYTACAPSRLEDGQWLLIVVITSYYKLMEVNCNVHSSHMIDR
jgi:hypothetical protein